MCTSISVVSTPGNRRCTLALYSPSGTRLPCNWGERQRPLITCTGAFVDNATVLSMVCSTAIFHVRESVDYVGMATTRNIGNTT